MKNTKIMLAMALAFSASLAVAADQAADATAPAANPAAAAAQTFKAKKLTRAEVDKLLAHPEKILVIDVRRPDELTKIGGLPVYLNIQVGDVEKDLAYIPKGRTIITVSNHAVRAGKIADLLTSKGFKVAGAVGVENYEQEGGTLTKVVPPTPKQPKADSTAAATPPAQQ